jgi:hypothetical protein
MNENVASVRSTRVAAGGGADCEIGHGASSTSARRLCRNFIISASPVCSIVYEM